MLLTDVSMARRHGDTTQWVRRIVGIDVAAKHSVDVSAYVYVFFGTLPWLVCGGLLSNLLPSPCHALLEYIVEIPKGTWVVAGFKSWAPV